VRQRFAWLASAANARWPDDIGGINLPAFNWVRIDNRGANDVVVAFGNPSSSDMDYDRKVKAGQVRTFNIAGPNRDEKEDAWSQELHLQALSGVTTVMIEIADHPIVDLPYAVNLNAFLADGDAQASASLQGMLSRIYGFNGATWDRLRTVGLGALGVAAAGTDLAVGAQVAAAANNQTLAGVAGKTTYISGFHVDGLGATGASTITVTITGLAGAATLSYTVNIPAGATVAIARLQIEFARPIPANAANTAIVVNVPSFGVGNTVAQAGAHGFQL
jgi:hypothetical protein